MMRMRVTILAALAVAGLGVVGLPASGAVADQDYWVPITKSWTITGHGYGHGHGMGQYGAEGAARLGKSYRQIVGFYYPGTSLTTATGLVRVLVSADYTSDVVVRPASGLTVTDLGDNTKWTLPAHSRWTAWRLMPVGSSTRIQYYRTSSGWHTWTTPSRRVNLVGDAQFTTTSSVVTLVLPGGVERRYRGAMRSARPYASATSRDTVNVLRLDDYVQGVVPAEMPSSWHQAALRAQAVAARTYGAWLRAQNPGRYYQVCDTTACQVYGGVSAEAASGNTAVQATANRILTYGGKPAFTQFSSSTGGWTSAGSAPYLTAHADPYDGWSGNPMHSWTRSVSAHTLESRYPGIGRLIKLSVTSRENHGQWGGWVRQIKLVGTVGNAYLSGDDMRFAYGLPSRWFAIDPTPIIARAASLTGRYAVGHPSSGGEYAIADGSVQDFHYGRIYWSAATGARQLKGRLLKGYRAYGGPGSRLGFPVTGMMTAQGRGWKATFEGGRMWMTRSTGAHVLYGAIMRRYVSMGGAASDLGFPTTDIYPITGGQRARFEHGTLTWNRPKNKVTLSSS